MFYFEISSNTQNGSYGFETDNQKLRTDWSAYYTDIIGTDTTANDLGYNYNESSGGNFRNTLFIWLWTLIAAKLPAYNKDHNLAHKFYIDYKTRALTTEQANNTEYMRQRDRVDENGTSYGATPASRHDIDIVFIKKGHDAFKYYHDTHSAQEIHSIGTLLTIDRYHKINVYRGKTGKITIVTTRWEATMAYKMIGLLPVFFPDIKAIVDNDPTIYTILKAYFDNTPELILPLMQTATTEYVEIMAKRNIDKLFTALESQKTKIIKSLESTIHSLESNIQDYIRALSSKYEELEKNQRSLTGYLTNPFVVDENLRPFLEKSKNIKIITVNGDSNYMRIQFTTPIMNWNKQDVEMYFKHDPKKCATYLNDPKWFADIIRKIFIDEEYQMICNTIVNMPIINKADADERWSTESNSGELFGNPHFIEFNCYRSSRNAYIQAIIANDYVRAISIILAATATLVFTDSSVIQRMASRLKSTTGSDYKKHIFKEVSTGTIYSMEELRKKFESTPEPTPETEGRMAF